VVVINLVAQTLTTMNIKHIPAPAATVLLCEYFPSTLRSKMMLSVGMAAFASRL
jgi:hypothetical protein